MQIEPTQIKPDYSSRVTAYVSCNFRGKPEREMPSRCCVELDVNVEKARWPP